MGKDFITCDVNIQLIRKEIEDKVEKPFLTLADKDDVLMYKVAEMAIKLVNKYVPLKSGDLRSSAHIIQTGDSTYIEYGSESAGKTADYASIQYDRDVYHPAWRYTTPGTKGDWFNVLQPGTHEYSQLTDYASQLIWKAVKK